MPTVEEILKALVICAADGPCEDCYRRAREDCKKLLMEDAAEVIDEFLRIRER